MEGKLKKSKGPNTHSVWWCYIVAILLILIYLLPIYIMLNLSFRTLQDLGTKLSLPAAWNFGNYVEVFKSGDLWLGFKNSIILVVETVTLEIVLSALAAYGLARSSGRLAESIRNINMGIMMIPSVALLVGTYGLMVKFHMTNTLYGLALLSAAGGIPGTMFMYVNFVVSIPTALDEAAAIDGANGIARIWYVTIPMLSGTTFFIVITSIINSFKVFGLINLMTHGGPGTATTMLVYNIYRTAFQFGKLEFASAQGIVLLAIIFFITWIQFRIQKRNEA